MSIAQEIFNIGEDAFLSYFIVDIEKSENMGSTKYPVTWKPEYKIRVRDISIPGREGEFYKVHYQGAQLSKPKAGILGTYTVKMVMRVDSNWDVYNALVKWWLNVVEDGDDHRVTLVINRIQKTSEGIKKTKVKPILLKECLIQNISELNMSASTKDPIFANITLTTEDIDGGLI